MKSYNLKVIAIIFILILSGCERQYASELRIGRGKRMNIILFIGDGMGVAQLYAGMTVSNQPFTLEKFPYSGFSKTFSADNYITDSGAGGTAISSGAKTNNGMIGVRPDTSSLTSIIEFAHKAGLATGVVSTSAITHATPASFVAHNADRDNYEEIAVDFLNGTIDLFIGGGADNFKARKDSADLTIDLKTQGFDIVYTLEDMNNSKSDKLAALLAKGHMPKASAGRAGALEAMTRKAIETLSRNKKGFFLMVEGSMIDWGGHENNIDYVVNEMIDLDQAIGVAYDYAVNTKNTLIIVTADHETGGLSLPGGNLSVHSVRANFSVTDHTSVMVPIFSYGPGAERYSGIHDNTFFLDEFLKTLKIKK
jgi:alkaline phosphatase